MLQSDVWLRDHIAVETRRKFNATQTKSVQQPNRFLLLNLAYASYVEPLWDHFLIHWSMKVIFNVLPVDLYRRSRHQMQRWRPFKPKRTACLKHTSNQCLCFLPGSVEHVFLSFHVVCSSWRPVGRVFYNWSLWGKCFFGLRGKPRSAELSAALPLSVKKWGNNMFRLHNWGENQTHFRVNHQIKEWYLICKACRLIPVKFICSTGNNEMMEKHLFMSWNGLKCDVWM